MYSQNFQDGRESESNRNNDNEKVRRQQLPLLQALVQKQKQSIRAGWSGSNSTPSCKVHGCD